MKPHGRLCGCGQRIPGGVIVLCALGVQQRLDIKNGPFAEPKLTPGERIALTRKAERRRLRQTGPRRGGGRSARGASK